MDDQREVLSEDRVNDLLDDDRDAGWQDEETKTTTGTGDERASHRIDGSGGSARSRGDQAPGWGPSHSPPGTGSV
jgi:hypothetical protein